LAWNGLKARIPSFSALYFFPQSRQTNTLQECLLVSAMAFPLVLSILAQKLLRLVIALRLTIWSGVIIAEELGKVGFNKPLERLEIPQEFREFVVEQGDRLVATATSGPLVSIRRDKLETTKVSS